ncbi:hypothetical protein PLESTB_000963400 [Pleodorina starrii]|uniref:Uncharacterized protein n=1 Tax=Pleodorina starrii TaxID=330485 RepID=A0A9W6F3K0_9CHLO|nr:hypothetical protein PLESTM_001134600 [Pleodorina starrii]GLC55243.1 hypothetical protein PLESTB_000963400 [Pleodorina starrii]GLC71002.1 hypothetical protein PLESTF_001059800 [Pleodorina starrii]
MHGPGKSLARSQRRVASQPTDTPEHKQNPPVPRTRRSCLQSDQEKHVTALPASLEPEPSHAVLPVKSRKAARSSTPVSQKQRPSAAAKKKPPARAAVKKVRFAAGPLKAPAGGPDGHPAAEGRVAKPVRILDGGLARGITVTKKDVRELELPELLGNEQYMHSMTKLKIRVGLLPAKPPSRPHASKPKKAAGRRQKREDDAAGVDAADGIGSEGTSAGRKKRRCGNS